MMDSVVGSIEELGVEVDHIPGGCTCLVQPVDVGINKPFKKRVRNKWEQWMMDKIAAKREIREPTRELIVGWCNATYSCLGGEAQMICNAWRHGLYTWFLPTCAPPPFTNAPTHAERAAIAIGDDGSNDSGDESLFAYFEEV